MSKKSYKDFIKTSLKLVEKKMLGTHPTRKEMVNWAGKYTKYNYIEKPLIIRKYEEDNPFEDDNPASYCQYLLFHITTPITSSDFSISSLPYRELIEMFSLDPVNDWIPEKEDEDELEEYELNY